jgi:hypothetical protein
LTLNKNHLPNWNAKNIKKFNNTYSEL